jgi:hypoxanthine-DNA glycosylase
MEQREKCLDPVFDENTKVIIMGTFPSIKSRGECYYNNPQNKFWSIIAEICSNERVIKGDYRTRYDCLRKNGIGLWDVISDCVFRKKSSKDNKIIKESIKYNDFSVLKEKCPKLECIVFCSKNTAKLYERYLKQPLDKFPLLAEESYRIWLDKMTNNGKNVLPSTSSANVRKTFKDKSNEWRAFLCQYIGK